MTIVMQTPAVVRSPTSAGHGVGRCHPFSRTTPRTRRVYLRAGAVSDERGSGTAEVPGGNCTVTHPASGAHPPPTYVLSSPLSINPYPQPRAQPPCHERPRLAHLPFLSDSAHTAGPTSPPSLPSPPPLQSTPPPPSPPSQTLPPSPFRLIALAAACSRCRLRRGRDGHRAGRMVPWQRRIPRACAKHASLIYRVIRIT